MRDGLKILDVDRHVIEPMDCWREYLPRSLHHLVPELRPAPSPDGETLDARLERLGEHALFSPPLVPHVGSKPLMRGVPEVANILVALNSEPRANLFPLAGTAEGQISSMDATGVDAAILLPTFAPYLVYDDEVSGSDSRAYAAAYNRWLADLCADRQGRLVGAALLSRHDPTAMRHDLEEAAGMGHRAVVLRPNPTAGRTLADPSYQPFWAACEEMSLPVLFHEGTYTRVPTAGADRFATHFGMHACSHPMEMMMAFMALLEGGVFERHPRLRVAFLESGCGWLPYWLWRLDTLEFAQVRAEVRGRIERPPSEYFKRQCFIALEPSETNLGPTIAAIGASSAVFGTDFPHPDHGPGIVSELLDARHAFADDGLRTILWDTPVRLLGFEPSVG